MDSTGVPIQFDPVAPTEVPKSRDVAPGKKRDDRAEGREDTVAALLTVSFSEILQSKKQDLIAGTVESAKKETARKAYKLGHKTVEERADLVKGQAVAAGKRAPQANAIIGAKATSEKTAATADTAMKTIQAKPPVKESKDLVQPAELPKRGALSAAEEAQLKEMIQKNGVMPGRKETAAQMKGAANGETLSRPEGIGAVKSMTAQEGEVLKNLSGGDDDPVPQKLKTGKPGKAQQAFITRDVSEGEGKTSQAIPSADKLRQEFANLMENTQDKLASSSQTKKQAVVDGANPEIRDVPAGAGPVSLAPQARGVDTAIPVRPQAVISQVLDGAVEVLRNGSERMVLTLQPPRLGTLDLDVSVKDNRVTMIMLADNQEVKQMLQSGMDDLRNALQDKGFQIDRLEVLVQNRPDDAGAGFWQEAGFAREDSPGREQRKSETEAAPAVQWPAERTIQAGQSGISIFA